MKNNSYELKRTISLLRKDENGFDIQLKDNYSEITQNFSIKYLKIIDDYIYKNLPTNVLECMKLKIENELMERKLKNYER